MANSATAIRILVEDVPYFQLIPAYCCNSLQTAMDWEHLSYIYNKPLYWQFYATNHINHCHFYALLTAARSLHCATNKSSQTKTDYAITAAKTT